MFVPLHHALGHAQADFGEALVVIGGIEQKAHFFALDLPRHDASYIRAYPSGNGRGLGRRPRSCFCFLRPSAAVGALRQRQMPGDAHPGGLRWTPIVRQPEPSSKV